MLYSDLALIANPKPPLPPASRHYTEDDWYVYVATLIKNIVQLYMHTCIHVHVYLAVKLVCVSSYECISIDMRCGGSILR